MANGSNEGTHVTPTETLSVAASSSAVPPTEPSRPTENSQVPERVLENEDGNLTDGAIAVNEEDTEVEEVTHYEEEDLDEDFNRAERNRAYERRRDESLARARFAYTIRDEVYAANPGARTMEIAVIMAQRWHEESAEFLARMEAEETRSQPQRAEPDPTELYGSDSDDD